MASVKSCFFRGCINNSLNCTRKLFIRVPRNLEVRKLWYEAARNTSKIPSTSEVFCCEDHFNLQTDCDNWQYFKTVGGKLTIKKGIVPRDLGPITSSSEESQLSKSAEKRKTEMADELFPKRLKSIPSSAAGLPGHGARRKLFESEAGPSTIATTMTPTKKTRPLSVESPSGKFDVSSGELQKPVMSRTKTKATQTNWQVRSVGVLVDFRKDSVDKATNTSTGIAKKCLPQPKTKDSESDVSSPRKGDKSDNGSYYPSSDSGNSTFKPPFPFQGTGELGKIEKNPRLYTGLPQDAYFLVEKLCGEGLHKMDVLLTLKKIRTNDSFGRLAIDFGYQSNYPSRVFNKTLPKMAILLQELIVWPSAEKIRSLLPQQFWTNYKKVQSIIDCFEIEIQKPSGAVHQALTWSQYKSCNTAKYLISSTPNGLVNFVSSGFGGRTSDLEIVAKSGYLDALPQNCQVLADRGFKQIVPLLDKKKCTLVRPPSVSSSEKQTKAQVRQSKLIASVRIHIERVIRRLREFKMIAPHACIPTKMLSHLDYIVIVACSIINLQGPLLHK